MSEIRYNNSSGLLGTSLTSASVGQTQIISNLFAVAPDFASLANGDFIKLSLDPPTFVLYAAGEPESDWTAGRSRTAWSSTEPQ